MLHRSRPAHDTVLTSMTVVDHELLSAQVKNKQLSQRRLILAADNVTPRSYSYEKIKALPHSFLNIHDSAISCCAVNNSLSVVRNAVLEGVVIAVCYSSFSASRVLCG